MHRTPAARRYARRFSLVSGLYVALIGANTGISHTLHPSQTVLGIMAVITALPIVAMLVVMGLYLREETDEFVRDRLVTSMLIGLGILFAATSILGLLQFERIVGDVPVFLTFPLWCAAFGLTQAVLAIRDRRADRAA